MTEASIADVREIIDTELTDIEIGEVLERAARAIALAYTDEDFSDLQHRADFEATLTALRTVGGKDRRAESVSSESAAVSYESSEIRSIRARLAYLDPGEAFSTSGVVRDSDRYVNSVMNT